MIEIIIKYGKGRGKNKKEMKKIDNVSKRMPIVLCGSDVIGKKKGRRK